MKNIIIVFSLLIVLGFGCANTETNPQDTETTQEPKIEQAEPQIQDGKSGAIPDEPLTYDIDTNESKIMWKGNALVKSQKGTISLSQGKLTAKGTELQTGTFTIDMNSMVATSLDGPSADSLIEHLKNEDFFNVKKYPTASFELTKVQATETAGQYNITGDFILNGKNQEITFPVSIAHNGADLTGNASLSIDRTKWGITYGSGSFFDDLGDKAIDDMIELTIELVATQQKR